MDRQLFDRLFNKAADKWVRTHPSRLSDLLWEVMEPHLAQPEGGRWIACGECMPEGKGSVLASGLDPDGNPWREIVSAEWLRDGAPKDFATHWMPLPNSPLPQREEAK